MSIMRTNPTKKDYELLNFVLNQLTVNNSSDYEIGHVIDSDVLCSECHHQTSEETTVIMFKTKPKPVPIDLNQKPRKGESEPWKYLVKNEGQWRLV